MPRRKTVDAKGFALNMKKFKDQIMPDDVLTLTKLLVFDLLSLVVVRTPVGNPSYWEPPRKVPGYTGGFARGNWQVKVGSPAATPIERLDPNGQQTIIAGQNSVGGAKPFQVIWVTNNASYIGVLELGRGPDESGVIRGSKQAPNGFLRVSLNDLRKKYA